MQGQKGFTLLELIVVTLIIGLMIGVINLSSGLNRQHDVQEEIERLAALIDLAAQESIFKSTEIALEFEESSYRFLTLIENEWQPIEADRILRQRQLPAGLEIELFVEGERQEIFSIETKDSEKKDIPPRIFLLSSGEITPFEVSLKGADGDTLYTLIGRINGELEIEKTEAKPS
ncbi:MAG: type II secretion system minor pseudopilin GspH [Gammaproteobacteria bacterium]|nr:type II secretion system minor pseudopilin GspH [Gammaproteobacteria bacterium]